MKPFSGTNLPVVSIWRDLGALKAGHSKTTLAIFFLLCIPIVVARVLFKMRASIEVYLFLAKIASEWRGFLNPRSSGKKTSFFLMILVAYLSHGHVSSGDSFKFFALERS